MLALSGLQNKNEIISIWKTCLQNINAILHKHKHKMPSEKNQLARKSIWSLQTYLIIGNRQYHVASADRPHSLECQSDDYSLISMILVNVMPRISTDRV